ncbi:MAG: DEAD/DEAH box helicase [Prochlorococcaceae cyanobacterium]
MACSFALGQRPAVQPRQWQSRLMQLLRARLAQPDPQGHDVLIHAGPGAGKTLGALLGVEQLLRDGRLQRFVVFCHRTAIASQWQRAAARLGLDLSPWGEQPAATGVLVSYQAAALHRERWLAELQGWGERPWLAIADEVHHLGVDPDEPEAAAWGHAFSSLSSGAVLRLGLTGTPFRADQLAFCAARQVQQREGDELVWRIVPDLCVEPRQLISAGDVRPLEFRFQDGWVDHARQDDGDGEGERSCLSAESRETWRARNLRRAIRLADGSSIAQRVLLQARDRLETVRQQHNDAGGLVIARDIAHARQVAALLNEQGDRAVLVHSLDPEAEANLAAFQRGVGDWLVSIDMCSEGFDAPRLRVVAYLSTVVTRSRFVQAITRAVRLDGGRERHEAIPRDPSYVFAPADPLLMSYARSWSLSEPYLLRGRPQASEPSAGSSGWSASRPPAAIADGAGSVIAMSGPQLPGFLQQKRPA